MSEYPSHWRVAPFCDLVTLRRGADLPVQNREGGEIPIFGSNGIVGFHSKATQEHPGIVTGRSGSIGNAYLSKTPFWALNTTLYSEQTHGNNIEYIFHFLKWFDLSRFSGGTGVPTLNRNDVHDQLIGIPPLPEQKKIAEILSRIDNTIIIYEQQAKALANLLDALMREKIVMNASTRWVKIGAACTAQAGGTPDRSVKRYYEGNIPWVKSGEVKGGNIIHTDESISMEAVSSSPTKIVPAGSVLIAMYGATAGQTARLRIDATTNQAVLSLNSSTSELSNDYLYHAVTAFKGQLLLACQGSGQPNLSSGLIKELEIPLLDLFTQNRISSALDSVNHRASLLRSKICSTMALKGSVSADLLSGRKRVTV
jgi:type I restriction enzyme S subunit